MHELSIASSIVEIAETEVKRHEARKVERIELDIGALSGVELDALKFIWQPAVKDTVLDGAERVIHEIPGKASCARCGHRFSVSHLYDACPGCGTFFWDIISGKELKVRSLTLIT